MVIYGNIWYVMGQRCDGGVLNETFGTNILHAKKRLESTAVSSSV